MYKYILLLLLIACQATAQVVSVSPAEEFQGQTVTTIIKLAPGVIQAANPPADSFDVYIQQGASRINCDDFTTAQIYPGTPPYDDSLTANFTIPAAAIPGWYDVHVTTYTAGFVPVDNILANGFVVRLPGSCPVPFNVVSSAVTGTSANIDWSPAVTADTFRVRYRELGTTNYIYKDVNGFGGISSTTLSGLFPGVTYVVDVSTICLGIRSTYSLPLDTFTTVSQAINCVIPYSVTYSAITNTSVTIDWNTNIVSDTFRIRYRLTGTTPYLYRNVNGSLHSVTITGLQPDTTYNFQVSSVCNGAGNGYTPVKQIRTIASPVNCTAIPFGLVSSGITNASATVSWSTLVTADSFLVRYSVNGTTNYKWKMVSGNSTTITGLLPLTTYQWQVRTKCNGAPPTSYSASDIFSTPLRMSGIEKTEASFNVFPNPSGGNYSIEFLTSVSQQADLIVTDYAGRVVYSEQIVTQEGLNTYKLSLSYLSSGVYYLMIKGDEINLQRHLILQQF